MKLLVVAMEFYPIIGGGGSYVNNLIKGLANQGVSVTLLTSGIKRETIQSKENLTIQRFPSFRKLYFGKGNFIDGINEIVGFIQQNKPHVIHSHHSLESLMVQAANVSFGIPHVVTHHKTPEYRTKKYELNGKWVSFNFVNQNNSTFFIAPSKVFARSLLNSKVDPEKIVQIYPGVDRAKFKKFPENDSRVKKMRLELGLRKEDLLIVIPAKIRERKGIEFALKGLKNVNVQGGRLSVLITGLAEEEITQKQKQVFCKLLLPNKLIEYRSLKDDEMPVLYSAANLTLLTSKAEGLGMVLLESMACECPIIGTDVIGINEVIEDRINGRLIPFGNKIALKEAVASVAENKEEREKYISGGLSSLETKFSLISQSNSHKAFYQALIKKKELTCNSPSQIRKLIPTLSSYKNLKDQVHTIAILLVGSVLSKDFVAGWSDLDMIIISNDPTPKYFRLISTFIKEVGETVKIKAGSEVIDYQQLLKVVDNSGLVLPYVKVLKNFTKENSKEKTEVLFLRKGYFLPQLNNDIFKKFSLTGHTALITNYMNKYLSNEKNWIEKKSLLRKIIKNSIFLIQSYLIVKSGKAEDDYLHAMNRFSKLSKLDLSVMTRSYQKRNIWTKLDSKDIEDKEIDENWGLFLKIVRENFKSNHK